MYEKTRVTGVGASVGHATAGPVPAPVTRSGIPYPCSCLMLHSHFGPIHPTAGGMEALQLHGCVWPWSDPSDPLWLYSRETILCSIWRKEEAGFSCHGRWIGHQHQSLVLLCNSDGRKHHKKCGAEICPYMDESPPSRSVCNVQLRLMLVGNIFQSLATALIDGTRLLQQTPQAP